MIARWRCWCGEEQAVIRHVWNLFVMACPSCLFVGRILIVEAPVHVDEDGLCASDEPPRVLAG